VSARTVIVGAAGSGGHIFPALAFIRALEKTGESFDIRVVTGRRPMDEKLLGRLGPGRVARLAIEPYRGPRSLVSPRFHAALWRSLFEAGDLVGRLKPALVVGFGGYPTVPLVLAARLAGVPTLIHEQNATLGLANRVLSRVALRTALAFPPEAGPSSAGRAPGKGGFFRAGMPLRAELRVLDRAEAHALLGLDPARKTLAVIGGSQGARALNDAMGGLVRDPAFGLSWQVVHLAGEADFETVRALYAGAGKGHRVFSFYEDMSIIYSCADVVLSRAGAVTLHELAFFGKCAILVPYPGAHGHQLANARVLADREAAFLVEQKDLGALRTDGAQALVGESLRLLEGKG
jgi:UDP-N-acetylglucosamine--N-acetylmuramyl-(pentapeptide) pyrophosphoryl-undecaprenol N-acetylglucosamine transferase